MFLLFFFVFFSNLFEFYFSLVFIDNAPAYRSSATLYATSVGSLADGTRHSARIAIASVDSNWFDAVGYDEWQADKFVDPFDPDNVPPNHYGQQEDDDDDETSGQRQTDR